MFLTDLSIKRPVVASVMSLVLVIFGLVTFQEIPTDELPDVQPPVVTIQTEYRGASAEIVDTQITQKIEDFVGGTPRCSSNKIFNFLSYLSINNFCRCTSILSLNSYYRRLYIR